MAVDNAGHIVAEIAEGKQSGDADRMADGGIPSLDEPDVSSSSKDNVALAVLSMSLFRSRSWSFSIFAGLRTDRRSSFSKKLDDIATKISLLNLL